MGNSAENQAKPVEKQKKTVEKQKKPSFFKGVKSEFKKITWPDKHATFKQAVAVVVISIVMGILIAVLDSAFQYGVNFLTSL